MDTKRVIIISALATAFAVLINRAGIVDWIANAIP
jgi:hypothetical protein